jgi:ribosomal protein L32
MARPNSYGSKSNRARRRAVADKNAAKTQVHCKDCGGRHREGRHYR